MARTLQKSARPRSTRRLRSTKRTPPGVAPPRSPRPPGTAERKRRGGTGLRGQNGGGAGASEYDFDIAGGPGSAFTELVVRLAAGQAILAEAGALQRMREGVERGRAKLGGVIAAVARAAADESAFLVEYRAGEDRAASAAARTVVFASALPGGVQALKLRPGESYKLARGAFLAASPGVVVSGTLNWKGLLPFGNDTGFVLPEAKHKGQGEATLFVSSFGAPAKHELGPGESLLVDNGLFLACPSDVGYEVVKLGRTLVSSILGGEGLGMKFAGPCVVYTQSRNMDQFVAQIAARLSCCKD